MLLKSLALLLSASANADTTASEFLHPPESGKFFYMDFVEMNDYGQHAVMAKL